MFEIEYKGANCVIISTKKSKIIVDPKLSVVGLKDVSTKGFVELATEDRFTVEDPEAELVISSPGEYGVAGFHIGGVAARRNIDTEAEGLMSTMYRIEVGDTRIGVIGNVYEKLSDEQLEDLGLLDILIIPVGGNGYTMDATGAAALTRQINPKVVIPVHYADSALKYEVPQDDVKLFIAELGAPAETTEKYKLKQSLTSGLPLSVVQIIRS